MAITETGTFHKSARLNVVSHLSAYYRRYQEYRTQRRQIAELRSVDPRVLRDMAIDRSEITSIVNTRGSERRRKCERDAY